MATPKIIVLSEIVEVRTLNLLDNSTQSVALMTETSTLRMNYLIHIMLK